MTPQLAPTLDLQASSRLTSRQSNLRSIAFLCAKFQFLLDTAAHKLNVASPTFMGIATTFHEVTNASAIVAGTIKTRILTKTTMIQQDHRRSRRLQMMKLVPIMMSLNHNHVQFPFIPVLTLRQRVMMKVTRPGAAGVTMEKDKKRGSAMMKSITASGTETVYHQEAARVSVLSAHVVSAELASQVIAAVASHDPATATVQIREPQQLNGPQQLLHAPFQQMPTSSATQMI